MAVAGLQNVFDSSFLRESESPPSRHWGEQDRTSTRASSLLQMWRELEGVHVVNHPDARVGERPQQQSIERSDSDCVATFMLDGTESVNGSENLEANNIQTECGTSSQSQVGSENEHEDYNSVGSEQSANLGEVERERVRQIFREWENSGAKNHLPNVSHINNHSRAQWLGENERGRVRIIREWVQVNCQQRGTCGSSTDEVATEFGSQIQLVRDGLLVNHCQIGERRTIRKLCGRQALLDLLAGAQRERKRELQELLEHRPVSNFPHRNRIQALLRGRFLRNEIFVQADRPTSRAASELGLLRQRNTVSDLREGFMSRLGNSVCGSPNRSQSDTSCNADCTRYRNDQFQTEDEQEVLDDISDLFEPSDDEREINHVVESSESDIIRDTKQLDSASQVAGSQLQGLGLGDQEGEMLSSLEFIVSGQNRADDVYGNWRESNNASEWVQEDSEVEDSAASHLQDSLAVFQEQDAPSSGASHAHEVDGQLEDLEVNATENFDWQETSANDDEWQESALDHEEGDWRQVTNVQSSEWRDGYEEGLDGTWHESTDNQWNQESSYNDSGGQIHTQEPHEDWHENGLQDAIDSWLDVPSEQEASSIGRIDVLYFQDDDNVHSMELRELLSRRRVSSLLRSGFRASLDQLIQSYVDRQGNASVDWEPDGTPSSPDFMEQGQEQQNSDQEQDGNPSDGIDGSFPLITASQPPWNQELQGVHWSPSHHNPHHHLGIEWEIINELRIDMVRLQQRLDNMQRMLEACMDMQLELQRSVRQEVSAALNWSAVSKDACKDDPLKDGSNWDYVRKGICCICCEHNIDSLMYRCGHMCTCTRCAENLVRGNDKCPMCWAPIVEVIRAYSVQ